MLTRLEVRNRQGSLLNLTFDDPSNGFVVADIDGLDPVKATLVSSTFAGADGSQYQSSRREDRNLLIKLNLEPDYISTSVRDLRNALYNYFMPKSEVWLRFFDDSGLEVDITGRVEDFKSKLFTDTPTADISLICFDPDFVDPTPVNISGMSTASTTSETGRVTILYPATVETGVDFTLNVDRSITQFTIYHRTAGSAAAKTFDFAAPLVAGDVLRISSVTGAKGVTLTRSGTESSLLRGKSPQSPWLELEQGENTIRVYVNGEYEDDAGIPFTISFTPRYGGL
jgi:hypothetical protein